jgi:hypothetical protein
VKFRVGDLLLIFSNQYHERYCMAMAEIKHPYFRFRRGRCDFARYSLGVWVSESGGVSGGWFRLDNNENVLLSDDRKIKFFMDPAAAQGWENFEPLPR